VDGVDVRLLLPMASDIPVVGALSRASYRPLLEGGVRIFEWNGPMLHAKTAVADGKWARVGSTNLNWVSWTANWELDVVVHDEDFAFDMEEQYLEDLENATEIVLSPRNRVQSTVPRKRMRRRRGSARGSASRAAAGAMGIGNAVSAAITNHRALGPAEARVMANVGLLLLPIAVVAWLWPRSVAVPVAVITTWVGITLLLKAWKLRRERTK
jgi:cardiolipin synthase